MALRGMNKLDSGAPDRRQKHAGMTMAEYYPTKIFNHTPATRATPLRAILLPIGSNPNSAS